MGSEGYARLWIGIGWEKVIAIVDYGLGNIKAFENVYESLGMPYLRVTQPDQLTRASKIILPGVGAFDHAMTLLEGSGLRGALDEKVNKEKVPVLGICVGMQIMARSSEEGTQSGLGWIKADVKAFRIQRLPLPHMGWNTIEIAEESPLLAGLESELGFYFLHSYYFHCDSEPEVLATSNYGGKFHCVVHSGNFFGVQFHPEKSHGNGVALLRNFGEM